MMLLLLACAGEPDREPESRTSDLALAPELVAGTWQVRMADATARAPYEAHPGWSLLFTRDLEGALRTFASDEAGLARAHLELAALWRQAARLAAEATLQVYGADRQATDPPDVDYLVGVSEVLLGRPTTRFDSAPSDPVFAERVAGWREMRWPPGPALELAADGPAIRTRELRERTQDGKRVEVVDPTELLALSIGHENEALRRGAPARWLDPWRFPVEPRSLDTAPIADGFLFGGFLPAEADVAFVAAACAGDAVPERFPGSVLAQVLAPAIADGRLDVQKARDGARDLAAALETAMAAKAGQVEGYQRTFAEIGEISVLRAAVCVADDLGQPDDAGLLRVEVADVANGPARDPVFLLSLAAWDAAHRNAVRSLDLLHALTGENPQLELARVPLDAMSVRLSRNSAPAAPVH